MKVILIDVDCMRADRLACYGSTAELTPSMDALADSGVVFTRAITAADTTGPSHASLFTSSYPFTHHFIRNAMRFPAGRPKLAEVLHRAGVATAAAVGVEHLSTFFGFGQGFDAYFNSHWFDLFFHYATVVRLPGFRPSTVLNWLRRRFPRLDTHSCSGVEVNQRITRWIRQNRERDFFVWLHYFDLHYPYAGEAGYNDKVRYVDARLGELMGLMAELGCAEETVFVVMSDHGEAFGEHGSYQHKNAGLYDETIRIPLILSGAGVPQGQRVESQVRTIDLAPTILALFGQPSPAEYQGVSLLPWTTGQRRDHLLALSYGYPTDRGNKCLCTGEWKYICNRGGRDELYHLTVDPQERSNVIAGEKERLAELQVLFFNQESHPEAGEEQVEDELLRHMLEGLGYL
jgi:choline-sulfatase